jgi:trigger factor
MNISRQNTGDLNAEITISVGPDDYQPLVDESIKKLQRKMTLPGFRPGKVPTGLIRKQYGKEILTDELNKFISDKLSHYINDNHIHILGDPIPSQKGNFDPEHRKEFEFVYELGLMPEFRISLDKDIEVTYKQVAVSEDLIDRYVNNMRKKHGKTIHPDEAENDDLLHIDWNELDESGQVMGDHHHADVRIADLEDKGLAEKLKAMRKGDHADIDAGLLKSEKDRKALFQNTPLETEPKPVRIELRDIHRIEEAELNSDFFSAVYPDGSVTDEQGLRDRIRSEFTAMFNGDADRFFISDLREKLISRANIQLPDEFLKRWLKLVNDKPLKDEDLEKEYPHYANDMRWNLIENRLVKDNGIQVGDKEIEEEARAYVRNEFVKYGAPLEEEKVNVFAADLIKKEDQKRKIRENLLNRKIVTLAKEKCTVKNLEVSSEEFFGKAGE